MALERTGAQQATPRHGTSRPQCDGSVTAHMRPTRSLLDVDDDVFHYVCAFVPLHDLLCGVALVSREAWRRVSVNHALWQKLWMRYLYHFCISLIPTATPTTTLLQATEVSARDGPSMLHPSAAAVDQESHRQLHQHNNYSRPHDTSWNLFHFHHSAEVRPHAVQLESLSVMREDIADPYAASSSSAAPIAQAATASSWSSPATRAGVHAELLHFAQACATQTVARNVTHTTATTFSTSPSSAPAGMLRTEAAAQSSLVRGTGRHPQRIRKYQQRHIDRLQRVLHFLLSADRRRPQFHDGLWTATHEAELAYLGRVRGGGDAASDVDTGWQVRGGSQTRNRQQHRGGTRHAEPNDPPGSASAKASSLRVLAPNASPPPPPPPSARLRPMSWLDSDAASVKVLLFDDDTRSIGDAAAVQAERVKLLASLADNWRTAYAAHFYPCPTDGKDPGSSAPHGPLPHPREPSQPPQQQPTRPTASLGTSVVGMPSVSLEDRTPRTPVRPPASTPAPTAPAAAPQGGATFSSGHAGWEQVYRRFRDGHNGPVLRSATAGNNSGVGTSEDRAVNDSAPLPSSSSPLFDLHLLGYAKRKQVYAAMLASTVEVPEGMGAFFATCVSEPFLRWWCWRNRRLASAAGGGLPGSPSAPASAGNVRGTQQQQQQHPRPPPVSSKSPRRQLALLPFTTPSRGEAATPRSLWVVRVALPRSGVASSARNPLRGPTPGAETSVAYSSSYSDMTSTSASTSTNERPLDGEEEVDVEEVEDIRGAEAGSSSTAYASTTSIVFAEEPGGVTADTGGDDEGPSVQPPLPSYGEPVALLFPLPHMLAYWFMMHHVSFYNYQVYRRTWGDQDLTIAVCSRILSPTGHSVECRLFYSLRCATFPRMFTKMMFTPGVLPFLTLQSKMTERSPYHSDSDRASSSSSTTTTSNMSHTNGNSTPTATALGESCRSASVSTNGKPVDSRQIYDLFWTGFGRVEVECRPTISRSNLVRLRIALGLPADFPMGLLWNVVMFASGLGPRILKEHRHSLHFSYAKTFTDVVAEEFGELECYGLGAHPAHRRNDVAAMANPLDADAADMRERHTMEAMARVVTQGLAGLGGTGGDGSNDAGGEGLPGRGGDGGQAGGGALDASRSTWSGDTSPPSATSYGSWNIDSEFSSADGLNTSGHLSDIFSSAYP